MSTHPDHDLDELSELLDGRLHGERLRAVEDRLRTCDECRAAHAALSWARGGVQRLAASSPEPPEALGATLRTALAREATPRPAPSAPRRSLLVARLTGHRRAIPAPSKRTSRRRSSASPQGSSTLQ